MKLSFFLPLLLLLPGCKPTDPPLPESTPYENHSVAVVNPYISQLANPHAIVGPFYTQVGLYSYSFPIFNPTNPYQIVYRKNYQLYFFDFETGITSPVIEQHIHTQPSWGANGWILAGLMTGLYKVKPNGDSLTRMNVVTKYKANVKWNPSASLFYFLDGKLKIASAADSLVTALSEYAEPFDWDSDTSIICTLPLLGKGIYRYYIHSNTYVLLYPNQHTYWHLWLDPTLNTLYASIMEGKAPSLIRFNYQANLRDTIKPMYPSYQYGNGGAYAPQTNMCILSLIRQSWKDSLKNELWQQTNLVLMRPDGSEERIVTLPE